MDEDYSKKQKYKALICKIPSIYPNIERTNYNNSSQNTPINNPYANKIIHNYYNDDKTKEKFVESSKIKDSYYQTSKGNREEDDNLFNGKFVINNFGECLVEFKLSNNQLITFNEDSTF